MGAGITSKALKQHNGVVCHDMAHWLFEKSSSFYRLDVSAKTGQVFFTEISIRLCGPEYDESYLSADTEGRLTLLHLQREGLQLKSWRWDDDGRLIDIDARVVRLKHPYPQKEIQGVVYTCLGEKSGTLLMKDNHGHVYAADVKTGVMQEVTGIPPKCNISRKKIAPLDMDWPAFLVSRLAIAK